MRENDLVDQISEIRTHNNSCWMTLLRIAVEADPERAKPVLREIVENDTAVVKLLRKLGE